MVKKRLTTIVFNRARKPVSKITDRAKRYRANAEGFRPPAPKQCGFCGARKNVEVHHVDGHEGHGAADNLMWACRRCNVNVGIRLRGARLGKKTAQYNPAAAGRGILKQVRAGIKGPGDARRAKRAGRAADAAELREISRRVDEENEAAGLNKWGQSRVNAASRKSMLADYGAAIKVMRGDFAGDVAAAVRTIKGTPADIRSAYTSRSWSTRKAIYGPSGRASAQSEIPF